MPKLQLTCGKCGAEKVPLSSGELVCRPCANQRNREYKQRHADRIKAAAAVYREKNRDILLVKHAEYRANNPGKHAEYYKANAERIKANVKAYRDEHKDEYRAYFKALDQTPKRIADRKVRMRAWKKANKHKVNADTAKRQLRLRQAAVAWRNDFLIEEIYSLAQLRTELLGFPWEVDHIVPLNSPSVCGLHCEANLQVIPAETNLAKGNRWWPDMPCGPDTLNGAYSDR